jgi:hypothetical protein
MTTKAEFNAEEWSQVLEGPPAAGLRVLIAERGGMIRETMAMGKAYAEAREQHGESALLDEIVSDSPSIDPSKVEDPNNPGPALMEQLRNAVATLETHAEPGDVDAYKNFIIELARKVASAKKEGGVLGIGGKPISDKEQAALDEIAQTLGVDASEAAPVDEGAATERGDE